MQEGNKARALTVRLLREWQLVGPAAASRAG
jgi:hypothetical protein